MYIAKRYAYGIDIVLNWLFPLSDNARQQYYQFAGFNWGQNEPLSRVSTSFYNFK